MKDLAASVRALAKEKNAIILAHTYTYAEVQDVADYVGDSFGLSKMAASVKEAEIILFAGVRFMAETAAILAPDKKVILPVSSAGCPMAAMINPLKLKEIKAAHPDAAVVCYVNSDASVKALSDVCVTSSNAVAIVRKLPQKQIVFVPDEHLGSFVAEQVPEKEVLTFTGYCPVHEQVLPEDVRKAKQLFPGAVVLMHPECTKEARKEADYVLSTGQMVELVKQKKHKRYMIVTEAGIIHTLLKYDPDAEYIDLTTPMLHCPNMKKILLTDLYRALEDESEEIIVPEPERSEARRALQLMMELG